MTAICKNCGGSYRPARREREYCSIPCANEGKRQCPRQRIARHSTPEPNTGCWLWVGFIDRDGYGVTSKPGRKCTRAHRLSYETYKGQIPDGLEIDHLCRVPTCVNPAHLEAVPGHVNQDRAIAARAAAKPNCPKGHPLPPHVPGRIRRCLVCNREVCRRGHLNRKKNREAQA